MLIAAEFNYVICGLQYLNAGIDVSSLFLERYTKNWCPSSYKNRDRKCS